MDVFVENLGKIWSQGSPEELVALTGINHSFGAQRFSCLLGPSGCGKSTLIKIVGGLALGLRGPGTHCLFGAPSAADAGKPVRNDVARAGPFSVAHGDR